MTNSDLQDISADSVAKTILECDNMGGAVRFGDRYRFGRSREYPLIHNGKTYDSKAILLVAYKHDFPEHGPIMFNEGISGGPHILRRLNELGFGDPADVVAVQSAIAK